MEEKTSTQEKVVVNTEKRDDGGGGGDYRCSNILICKYPLHEVLKAIFFKCFGFETSSEPADASSAACCQSCSTPDVKEMEPSTTEPVPSPSSTAEDLTMRFRPPPKLEPSKGSGPETNSSGNS